MATKRTKKITKPQPQPQAYDKLLALAHVEFNRHYRERLVGPSNYPYRVGEKVLFSFHTPATVEEVLEDGRILHLSYRDEGTTYGVPYDNGIRPRIAWWVDVEPLEPVEETRFSRPRITTQFLMHPLGVLIDRVRYRGLIDSPEYQRGYVWTLEDKQRLVRSIFNRTDIGKFVFLEHSYPENRLEVLDGKQRLNAIIEFTEGRFAFNGKTWFQLSWEDKRAFNDLHVSSTGIESDRIRKSDIYWLFLTLNTGGVPQTDEQVAHVQALYDKAIAEEAKEQAK